MEDFQSPWIRAVILEHACKHGMKSVIKRVNQDTQSSVIFEHFKTSESTSSKDIKVDPLVLFVCTLKEFKDNLSPLEKFTQYWSDETPSDIIDLLESTFKQNNYTTLKKFLTLVSGLKLLDLLNLIVESPETSLVVRKLYSYFPKWTDDFQASFEKDFNVTSQKVSEKVKESNTQCRRLILKLAADKAYKIKYVGKQYQADLTRLTKEFDAYLSEIISNLECSMGPTVLEKLANGEISPKSDDWPVQFLIEYILPGISEDTLVRYLEDFEVNFNTDSTPCLQNCLTPFESMSEDESQSENEDVDEDIPGSVNGISDLDFACDSALGVLDSM